jgi:hypothetical protein
MSLAATTVSLVGHRPADAFGWLLRMGGRHAVELSAPRVSWALSWLSINSPDFTHRVDMLVFAQLAADDKGVGRTRLAAFNFILRFATFDDIGMGSLQRTQNTAR